MFHKVLMNFVGDFHLRFALKHFKVLFLGFNRFQFL